MLKTNSKLYIVATPIGNLADISFRAVEVLKNVDVIAAEDTRHARGLLQHYGIDNRLISVHEHNEDRVAPQIIEDIRNGLNIALISDAGTPLMSDPGMPLVKLARESGVEVLPIPGPCAVIAALSSAGLAVSRFSFEGFAPRTSTARQTWFEDRKNSQSAWVFYESSHRILASITDLAAVLPSHRQICVARELTKLHETIVTTTAVQMQSLIAEDANMRKGEFVVIVEPAEQQDSDQQKQEQTRILKILLQECSVKTAVSLTSKITGGRKKPLYQQALDLSRESVD